MPWIYRNIASFRKFTTTLLNLWTWFSFTSTSIKWNIKPKLPQVLIKRHNTKNCELPLYPGEHDATNHTGAIYISQTASFHAQLTRLCFISRQTSHKCVFAYARITFSLPWLWSKAQVGSETVRIGPTQFPGWRSQNVYQITAYFVLLARTYFFWFSLLFRVYVVFCFLVSGCQYQCNSLPVKVT